MDKLGDCATQTGQFLRSFAADLDVKTKSGEWLARDFTGDSVAFDGVLTDAMPDAIEARGLGAFAAVKARDTSDIESAEVSEKAFQAVVRHFLKRPPQPKAAKLSL